MNDDIQSIQMNFFRCLFLHLILLISQTHSLDYSLTIDEKTPIEQSIYHFSSPMELINNFQMNFNLTSNQQDLILTKMIDRDLWCSQNICSCDFCSLTLQFFSNENQFQTLNITINDLNDHRPEFLDIQTNISLSESIQIGHRFPIARAIDFDSGPNGRLTFQLEQIDDYFQLDIVTLSSNEYALYAIVKRNLDREILENYSLIIHVNDHGIPMNRSNQMNITIEILDENDNAPKFNQTEYSIQSLPENTPIGVPLLTIFADDADQGLNGFIRYSIVTHSNISSSFPFTIDSLTGVIRLRSSLDFETTRSFRFLLRASDSSPMKPLFTDTWLSVSIEDVNDCPIDILFLPHRRFRFEEKKLFLEENLSIHNLTLGYVRLSDRDSIPTAMSLKFELIDSSIRQDFQLIPSNQPNTFTFSVQNGNFDREIQNEIRIRFVAFDTLLTSTYELILHIIDLNDNPSEFSSKSIRFSIEEIPNYQMTNETNDDQQIFIGILNSTDRDEGENARSIYQLEENRLVKIDSKSGRIHLTQPIDREEISQIVLRAKSINIAEPKWETDVEIIIDVLDVNDEIPQCSSTFQRLVLPESFPLDQSLIKINGTDRDNGINGTIEYSLRTNSSWPFEIDRHTGEIFTRKSFDFDSEFKEFLLIIDLTDRGDPIKLERRNACRIELKLTDVNDNRPELIDEEQREIFFDFHSLNENSFVHLNITDIDSELNGKLKFSLESIESTMPSDLAQTLFQLHSNGSLQIIEKINEVALFKLKIFVEDFGFPSQHNVISISIAFGDRSNLALSSFGKVSAFFDEQRSNSNRFAFLFGLTLLIITFVCCLSMIVICVLMREHRRRQQEAIVARKKLLCSSSQQLTPSDSATVNSQSTILSFDRQVQNDIFFPSRSNFWNPRSSIDQHSLVLSSTPESDTYKILHIPIIRDDDEKDRSSSDHGYHGSCPTRSPSSTSTEQISTRRDSLLVHQLPYFVTRCKSLTDGFIIEMNVDGSDEDAR